MLIWISLCLWVFGHLVRSVLRIGLPWNDCLMTMMMLLDPATFGAHCLVLSRAMMSRRTARRAALQMRMRTAIPNRLTAWAN